MVASPGSHSGPAAFPMACDNLLIKLAARCNIACTYCYWFRDKTVLDAPAVLTEEAEAALIEKLERHFTRHRLAEFSILFHGGEPMLFGKKRFRALCAALRQVGDAAGTRLRLSIMTNGLKIDPEWVEIFKEHSVKLGISIDGPEELHDAHRIDFKGRGTHARTVAAIEAARQGGLEPGILAVCNPRETPDRLVRHFVEDLRIGSFDILVPDATHEDEADSIAPYYKRLFDLWYDDYADRGVEIRYLSALLKGLLGGKSGSQVIGYGPVTSVTMLTDGSLEALDTLRIAGDGSTRSALSIQTHELDDIAQDPLWREIVEATTNLAPACEACVYREVCGGGHVASRWSDERRYDNPSRYCADIKDIIAHVWDRVRRSLYVEVDDEAEADSTNRIAEAS